MKNILTILIALVAFNLFGQLPDAFTFQAIAMDASGEVVVNSDIGLQVSIWQNGPSGTKVYSEEQLAESTDLGHIIFELGRGAVVGGTALSLTELDWTTGTYFVEIEMDATGGNDYRSIGFVKLVSVPFALAADISLAGFQGPAGPTGAKGPIGEKGVTGEKGQDGNSGRIGPSGGRGQRGPEGAKGPAGPAGRQGEQGETGLQGADGIQGPDGPQGAQGPQGEMGIVGEKGPQGPKGDIGLPGKGGGPAGAMGPQGPTGPDQGIEGKEGPQGPPGPTGLNGNIGPQGTPGQDGFGELQLRAIVPDHTIERLYIDTGVNRVDGQVGLRFYDYNLNAWVDLY